MTKILNNNQPNHDARRNTLQENTSNKLMMKLSEYCVLNGLQLRSLFGYQPFYSSVTIRNCKLGLCDNFLNRVCLEVF